MSSNTMQDEHRLSLLKIHGLQGAVSREDVEGLQLLLDEYTYDYNDLAKALRAAAQKGNEDCAKLLIQCCKTCKTALLDLHDQSGYSPLIIACRQGHAGIVKLLIEYKCNINKPTLRIRATGLHWAATYGHEDCMTLLIKAGCNIEAKTIQGRTPLMLAARSGFVYCVEMLLLSSANVHNKDLHSNTALHYACEEGNLESAKHLINAGADINAKSSSHMTALLLAAKKGHDRVIALLLGQPKIQIHACAKHMTAMHWAAESGNVDCLKLLIAHGLDPDKETESGSYEHDHLVNKGLTPLMVACKEGQREAVKCFLENDCSINHSDSEGYSPLTHAIYHSHPDCVLDLIRAGATINASSPTVDNFQCPLFVAIKRSLDCLKLLLRANVTLNMVGADSRGMLLSPLELALSSSNRRTVCRMLLVAGYRPSFIANPHQLQEYMATLVTEDEELFFHISGSVENCGTLLELCRDTIRSMMGTQVLEGLESLPLPQRMRDIIYIKELDSLC